MLNNLKAAAEALKKKNEPATSIEYNEETDPITARGIMSGESTYTGVQITGAVNTNTTPITLQDISQNIEEIKQSLRKTRIDLGLTQREVARRSGMSQGTITRAENHMWVSLDCVIRISIALGKQVIIN